MLLKELSDVRGTSGNEGAVRDLIVGALDGSIDESKVDALGNLICVKKSRVGRASSWPTKVMLAAHMDPGGGIVAPVPNCSLANSKSAALTSPTTRGCFSTAAIEHWPHVQVEPCP